MGSREGGGAGASAGRARQADTRAAAVDEPYREFRQTNASPFDEDDKADQEMAAYLQPIFDEQMEGASALAWDAHGSYKSYSKINGELRRDEDNQTFQWNLDFGRPSSESAGATVGQVAAALDSTMRPSKENLVLWRGINDMPQIAQMFRNGTLEGAYIDDKAFVSTSLKKSIAQNFSIGEDQSILIKLRAPKGTRMAVADQNYNWSGPQREIILARKSRIRITKVTGTDSNMELEGEIVQD